MQYGITASATAIAAPAACLGALLSNREPNRERAPITLPMIVPTQKNLFIARELRLALFGPSVGSAPGNRGAEGGWELGNSRPQSQNWDDDGFSRPHDGQITFGSLSVAVESFFSAVLSDTKLAVPFRSLTTPTASDAIGGFDFAVPGLRCFPLDLFLV